MSTKIFDVDAAMQDAAKAKRKNLVDFFIKKGANDWNMGMGSAAEGGSKDLVDFFIEKGAYDWDWGMVRAASGGHKDLVDFFIEKGADDWGWGLTTATIANHSELVNFFIDKTSCLEQLEPQDTKMYACLVHQYREFAKRRGTKFVFYDLVCDGCGIPLVQPEFDEGMYECDFDEDGYIQKIYCNIKNCLCGKSHQCAKTF